MYNVHFSSSLVTKETMRLLGSQPKSGQGTVEFDPFSISGTCSIKKTTLTEKKKGLQYQADQSLFFYWLVVFWIETDSLVLF